VRDQLGHTLHATH
jgi:hypothetical protein